MGSIASDWTTLGPRRQQRTKPYAVRKPMAVAVTAAPRASRPVRPVPRTATTTGARRSTAVAATRKSGRTATTTPEVDEQDRELAEHEHERDGRGQRPIERGHRELVDCLPEHLGVPAAHERRGHHRPSREREHE